MVLVHDDDLAQLDGFGDDTVSRRLCSTRFYLIFSRPQSPDTLSSGEVATQLRHSKPEIREVLFHPGEL